MDTSSKILEYLQQHGITQTFVAKRGGIGISKLNMALNGKRRLSLPEYERICGVLGVGVDAFLTPRCPDFIETEIKSHSTDL